MELLILLAFAIYFVILLTIGCIFYTRRESASEFILGNRSVNYVVTAIAAQASDMGSWLFLGYPAAVYLNGIFEAWTAIGLVIFMALNWYFIAPALRKMTATYNCLTLTELFDARIKNSDGYVRLLSASICVLFFTFYIASALVGLGRLFEAAFGLSYHTGIIIGLASALIYTIIGGFLAVAWSNLFQGIFLLAMIVLVPAYVLFHCADWSLITQTAHARNISLSLFPANKTILDILSLAAGWGLGYFGQPHILYNFMGIDDPKKIRAAMRVGISWQIIVLLAATCVGLVGLTCATITPGSEELLFIILTKQFFPPLIAGFVLCAILAATLSSMNGHILIAGSVIACDMWRAITGKILSNKNTVLLTRLAAISVSLVALYIAFDNTNSVYGLVNYAWSGLGAAFGPLVIATLYWNRVTRNGALAALLTGSLVAGLWHYTGFTMLPLVPAFVCSAITLITTSLFFSKTSKS